MKPLTKAFKELRQRDYVAERKIACCRSCAWAMIPEDRINLVVFTTEQSDNFPQTLYWHAPDDNPNEIIKVLRANGLKVKKPKNASFAIQILE